MRQLAAPVTHWVILLDDPAHRAFWAKVLALVEEGGHDLCGRSIDEARASEGLTHLLALGLIEGLGRRVGCWCPGVGLPAPVERGTRHTQCSARRRDADLWSQGGSGHQDFPLSKLNPSGPATCPWTSRIVSAVASCLMSRATSTLSSSTPCAGSACGPAASASSPSESPRGWPCARPPRGGSYTDPRDAGSARPRQARSARRSLPGS